MVNYTEEKNNEIEKVLKERIIGNLNFHFDYTYMREKAYEKNGYIIFKLPSELLAMNKSDYEDIELLYNEEEVDFL